jgi:hypothetical protein
MGNCCQKKKPADKNQPKATYQKASIEEVNVGSGLTENLIDDENRDRLVADKPLDVEAGHSVDPVFLRIIEQLNLKDKLDAVEQRIKTFNKAELKLISDAKDPFTLYFDVKTDDTKDKYHTTLMCSQSHLGPLQFKLANSMIAEEDELKISSSYERFSTLYRVKIDGVFYIFNYALYKQVMLFSKKDLLIMKAFKLTDNGDVVEITASCTHPNFEEKKGVDRMKIIETMSYYQKKPDGGCEATTLNSLYPRVGAGFTILKPIFSKSFRTFNSLLADYLAKVNKTETQLEAEFVRFP